MTATLQHPAHRHLAVMRRVAGNQVPELHEHLLDPDSMRLERVMRQRNKGGVFVVHDDSLAAAAEAYDLFLDASETGLRFVLEAALLSGASDQDIAAALHLRYGAETVRVYAACFFDISAVKADAAVLYSQIIGPAIRQGGQEHDLVLKLIALRFALPGLLTFLEWRVGKQDLPKEIQCWLGELAGTELTLRRVKLVRDELSPQDWRLLTGSGGGGQPQDAIDPAAPESGDYWKTQCEALVKGMLHSVGEATEIQSRMRASGIPRDGSFEPCSVEGVPSAEDYQALREQLRPRPVDGGNDAR